MQGRGTHLRRHSEIENAIGWLTCPRIGITQMHVIRTGVAKNLET